MENTTRRARNRWLLYMLIAASANVIIFLLSISIGEYRVPLGDAFRAAFGIGDNKHVFIVNGLREPRAIVAFLAGCGLAVSGAILQGITRNPLASPGVVGLNAGAAFAAVAAIVYMPFFSIALLPFAAFGGALLAALLTYSLAWRKGVSPARLLLVGIAVSSIAGAGTTFFITAGEIKDVSQALVWMAGSVYGKGWEHVWPLLPWLLVLFPAGMLQARQLNIFQMGDETAAGLGSRVELHRGVLLLISVGLAGSAVAMAGTVGFVGLMAPHISRMAAGASYERLLPAAALTGGFMVAAADLLGRTIVAPYEIPCGIITSIIGAPYMLYLLFHRKRG